MSRFFGLVFAACLVAIWTPTPVAAANPDWPKSLLLVTASPGGVYYIYGEELAQILTDRLGLTINTFPAPSAIHNIKLLDSGEAQLALITMATGRAGWNATGAWTDGKQFRNMRALFPMYDNPFQAVVLVQSGITNWAELTGKRIGVGPRSGNGGIYGPVIFKIIGISPQLTYGSYDEMTMQLLDGRLDALLAQAGAPMPAIQKAEAKAPIKFLSFSAEQLEAIRKAVPEFQPSKIPAGTYRLLDKDYVTLGDTNFCVGRADLPDDLVYQILKAVFENQHRLTKVTSLASDTLPQNAVKNTFLPFHPGAIRYYREMGIKIPDALVPTN
jgi:TRAP transporter TAXI family solute receptor